MSYGFFFLQGPDMRHSHHSQFQVPFILNKLISMGSVSSLSHRFGNQLRLGRLPDCSPISSTKPLCKSPKHCDNDSPSSPDKGKRFFGSDFHPTEDARETPPFAVRVLPEDTGSPILPFDPLSLSTEDIPATPSPTSERSDYSYSHQLKNERVTCKVPLPQCPNGYIKPDLNPHFSPQLGLDAMLTVEGFSIKTSKLRHSLPHLLSSMTCPNLGPKELEVSTLFNALLFHHDDTHVDTESPSIKTLMPLIEHYKAVMATHEPPFPKAPDHLKNEAQLLAHIYSQLQTLKDDSQSTHHLTTLTLAWLTAGLQEVRLADQNKFPSLHSYLADRGTGGAVPSVIELSFLLHHIQLPKGVTTHPTWSKILCTVALWICIANDNISLNKEFDKGLKQNLILIYQHQNPSWSFQKASDKVYELHLLPLTEEFETLTDSILQAIIENPSEFNIDDSEAESVKETLRDAICRMYDWMLGYVNFEKHAFRHRKPPDILSPRKSHKALFSPLGDRR